MFRLFLPRFDSFVELSSSVVHQLQTSEQLPWRSDFVQTKHNQFQNTLHQFGIHLKKNIYQVEQIQRKAARYVFNDNCDRSPGAVSNMIDILQCDSLACRRTKASLILLYKINGDLVEVPTTMLSQYDRRTRVAHKFRQIQSNKDCQKFSFFPNTISVWNSLPQSIVLSPNLESFKSGISTLTFEGFPTNL